MPMPDTTVSISTPADGDIPLFTITKLKISEVISKPFIVEVYMYAPVSDIPSDLFTKMIEGVCTITLSFYNLSDENSSPAQRYFTGIVGEFQYTGEKDGRYPEDTSDNYNIYAQYKAVLYPDFWKMKYSKNYMISQDQSALDIITGLLSDNDINNNSDNVDTSNIKSRDYCVQYGETNFDYVSRLMEEEGVFYYFEHEDDQSTMYLGNENSDFGTTLDPISGKTFTLGSWGITGDQAFFDSLTKADFIQCMIPNEYIDMDFDFKSPSATLNDESSSETTPDKTFYDYPAGYVSSDELVVNSSQIRLTGKQVPGFSFLGESTSPFLSAGNLFTLQGPDLESWDSSWNQDYIISSITHTYDFGFDNTEMVYRNKFTAFPSATSFVPERVTKRPRIHGVDTAIVVGPDGEGSINTDEYNRIQVYFPWDHDHTYTDDSTTCWIRVAQSWAGSGYGNVFTPRVGQEVLVSFINGNPDRPIVTGGLYNADNMPPYRSDSTDYPKSTIRSQSTPGEDPDNYNELRFDDTSDSEEIYIHAQKDMNTEILNDETITIGNDQTITIGGNKSETIAGNYDLNIEGDFTIKVGGDLKIEVMKAMHVLVVEDITMDALGFIAVGALGFVSVRAGLFVTISALMDVSISAGIDITVNAGTDIEIAAGAAIEVDAGSDIQIGAGVAIEVDAGSDIQIGAGAAIEVDAGADIQIGAGAAIEVDAGADIEIGAGAAIEIVAGVDIDITAGMAVEIEGGMMAMMNGGLLSEVSGGLIASVDGGIMVDVQGILTLINCA